MASTFALAPSPKWYFFDASGALAAGGKMQTFSSLDHSTPKFVFSDPGGMFPYVDPIILDGTGGTPVPMYWENNGTDLYFVIVYDAGGNIIFSVDNFPITGGGGGTPVSNFVDIENHIINGQFLFIDFNNEADSVFSPVPTGATHVAPGSGFFNNGNGTYVPEIDANIISGWSFVKTGGAGSVDTIQFVEVTSLGALPPINPSANATRYFQYSLASISTPVTDAALVNTIPGVQNFQNEMLTIYFENSCNTPGTGAFEITQYFGVGGSPSVTVSVPLNFVSSAWAVHSFQLTLPSIIGKTIGPGDDDAIFIRLQFPLNTIGQFNAVNFQLQRGNFASPTYIEQSYAQEQYKVLIDLMTIGNALFVPGELKVLSSQAQSPIGWIPINNVLDSLGSNSSGATFAGIIYKNLYVAWWNDFPQSECIVAGGRGADAVSDFNANKMMTCPQSIVGSVFAAFGNSNFIPPSPTTFGQFIPGVGTSPGGGTFYLALYVKI